MQDRFITREIMFEPLLAADPSFQPCWDKFLAEWSDEPLPPVYLALGSLAEHLMRRVRNKDTIGFRDIFAVVEDWHMLGDAYVSEAASIGFLETLQNLSGGSESGAVAIEQWLGPESKRWWDKLNGFWADDANAPQLDT